MKPRRMLANLVFWAKSFRHIFTSNEYKTYEVLTDTRTGGEYLILSTSVLSSIPPAGSLSEKVETATRSYKVLVRSVKTGAYALVSWDLFQARRAKGRYKVDWADDARMEKWFGTSPLIREMTMDNKAINLSIEHEFSSKVMIRAFGEMLMTHPAENYIESRFLTPQGDFLTVTVQKQGKKTPHQLRAEAETKVAELEQKLKDVGAA